jgi:hypothetical protein
VARADVETQVAALSSKQADPGRALDAQFAMLRAWCWRTQQLRTPL